jgi:concanavalin A-like lectin/glucanase superfamily protein
VDKLLACLLTLLLIASPASAARQFNGTDQSLNSAASIDLTATDHITVAWWGWVDAFGSTKTILESSAISDSNAGSLGLFTTTTPDFFFQAVGNVGASTRDYPNPSDPAGGAWHHYVVVLDFAESGGFGEVKTFYLDGALQTSTANNAVDNTGSFGNYVLNVMARDAGGTPSLFLAGRMAELAIWKVDFVQADVDSLYASGAGADATTVQGASLNNYWHLCGTSGSSTEPATTGGVDMTVHGATFVAHPISGMCGAGGYILTEIADCINAENADRLITEDATAGVGPCAESARLRTLQGVGL